MPASPVFSLELRCFGLWRLGIGTLVLVTLGVVALWLAAVRHEPWFVFALLASAGALAAALSLLRVAPRRLRWDGQIWTLDEQPGTLAVAIDAGGWMLLRFRRAAAAPGRRIAWLPAQRRGLAGDWHALRCAVYSPRPASGGPAAAETATAPE